jgi:cysteinyl-tRNA synthetase
MSKSLGNSFLPGELFSGNHPLLEKGYSPMTVRFFMLQSHYSSTLDFSNEALNAAEKGFRKLAHALTAIKSMHHGGGEGSNKALTTELAQYESALHTQMSDDFNTAKTLAVLFEMSAKINDFKSGNLSVSEVDQNAFDSFRNGYITFMQDVLGLKEEASADNDLLDGVIEVLIELRKKARTDRNFALSDKIRDDLKKLGVQLMDGKNGDITYSID